MLQNARDRLTIDTPGHRRYFFTNHFALNNTRIWAANYLFFANSVVKSPKNSAVHVIHLFLTFDWQTASCKCTCLSTVLNVCTKAHFSWQQNVASQATYFNFPRTEFFFAPPNFHAWNLLSPQIETTAFVSKQKRNFSQRDTFKVVSFCLI